MTNALFWDFDGTLSYPNKSFLTALHTAFLKNGYSVAKETTAEFLKSAYSWRNPETTYPEKIKELWWENLFEKMRVFCEENVVKSTDVPKICTDFREILLDVSNYQLYDDTVAVLEKCTELGWSNYLITNNYPEIVDNLEKLGIAQFFAGFIVSTHIGYEKPRREFFEYAKAIAKYPEVAYVIGDNTIADIRGGKEAGFETVAVHECKDSEADYYIETLSQIFQIIK